MKRLSPEIVILASRFDLGCDYVVAQLAQSGSPYLRLNTEDMPKWKLMLDPIRGELLFESDGWAATVSARTLRSIWYRRGVYPRDFTARQPTTEDQIARVQWAAFMRSLMVFDCLWVNNPSATYVAEHKAVQLKIASKLGFTVPDTMFTNDTRALQRLEGPVIAMKGIETVIAFSNGSESFAFTSFIERRHMEAAELQAIPVTLQTALADKLDMRVTVVGEKVFPVSITRQGERIAGDWRKNKEQLCYRACELPPSIRSRCIALTRELGLSFGAIDLVFDGNRYYFLEINPTGEWAWLVEGAGLPIHKAIASLLTC